MIVWRKSSYSQTSGTTDCVELANLGPEVGVRDSKAPERGHLALSVESFAELVARAKRDELNLSR
ncbi:DUF397 domain-containing protein [Actinomadura sp. NPDC047616]|uniref:DUF397 domain-containing protein n=1 Tax=Actinomadura sp. NPDC047616 TaxID=3155914 RepID=UPI0033E680C5